MVEGLNRAGFLHPPDVQLQVAALGGRRVRAAFSTPGEEAAQVRVGVLTGRALEAGQVGDHGQPQVIRR